MKREENEEEGKVKNYLKGKGRVWEEGRMTRGNGRKERQKIREKGRQ